MGSSKSRLIILTASMMLFECGKPGAPTGFWNSDLPPPERVFVRNIKINAIPFTDEHGTSWDQSSGPDVYPILMAASDTVISFRSSYNPNTIPSDLPLQWSLDPEFEITDWSAEYYVSIWDRDTLEDDHIGSSASFSIDAFIPAHGYESTIVRGNGSMTIETVITLRWQ